jgi:hypothetical protein
MTEREITDRTKSDVDIFKPSDPKLAALYEEQVCKATNCISWYAAARGKKRWATLIVRWTAVAALGGAAAIVGLQAVLSEYAIPAYFLLGWNHQPIPFNILELALAGLGSGVLVVDSIFGYSTGWVRYMLTELAIQKTLDDFKVDWAIATLAADQKPAAPPDAAAATQALAAAQADLDQKKKDAETAHAKVAAPGSGDAEKQAAAAADKALADSQDAYDAAKQKADAATVQSLGAIGGTAVLLQMLKTFSARIDSLVSDETQQWVIEFQSSMALLQKSAKDAQPASNYGSVNVTITRGTGVDANVQVWLDAQQRPDTTGNTAITNVPAGTHVLKVMGKKGAATVENSLAVTVAAGTITPVSIALG